MNLALLLQFTKQDFVDRYSGSVLGGLWAFIHPLVMIFIFVVIFANVMGTRLPGISSVYSYGIYLVAGLLPWMAFANTINRCATVFLDKRNIIGKVRVSLHFLPLYVVISEALTFLIAYMIFMLFLVFTGAMPGQVLIIIPFVFLVQQVLALGLGLIFGVLNVFLRDIKEMVTVLMTFWFWLTPIVWVMDIVPPVVQQIQQHVNPAFLFVDAYHQIMVHGHLPDIGGLMKLVLIGHAVLLLAYLMLRWLEKDIRDFL
ncbi:ABC transporter permease [Ectothiorhodospira variabilis]|uniref:ABC transporter permease n=1 Tax=Ectothiorhodospira variabilis TaxID=505694 RepID=UPI001EFBF6DC|nr:ABC transporter permease [Ectothiorhodospira variabilis]MCG5495696.1 ABC transporter permease [Ectothiorhodospira variabilis]MCG5496574.1 ABC transporter permease [Ectothiorhodospira variabilis]MCG5504592.1 ABC transporter permease [Ectothiorhodospira variabilis]MCG5507700.1 ABC transporter permease [Ectothiorhodospira variabilis]